MSRWFRFYDDAINDPKLLRLSDAMFRAWATLLCIASKNDGSLPPTADIALMLRVKPAKIAEWLAVLTTGGLFDNNDGVFSPHNWNARQFKSDVSTERVKRFRKQERNVSETVNETPPETEQKQITEAEKKDPPLRVVDDWPKDFGDQFWEAYPRKTEKLAAMKKLATLRKSGIVTFADLMAGVKRYAAAMVNTDQQYVKQPTAWLNAGRWADEIQTGGGNGNGTGNTRTTGHDAILAVAARKARELDRNDEMARPADPARFAFGDGADRGGQERDQNSPGSGERDRHRVEPDDQRIREGEIIPPDQDAAGVPGRRQFV